jgi:hypothetical protein
LRFIADDNDVTPLPDHYLAKCEAGKRMARDAYRELNAATNSTLLSLSFSVRSFSKIVTLMLTVNMDWYAFKEKLETVMYLDALVMQL